MDAKLLALTLDLQRRAKLMTQTDNLQMRCGALDMLDYLGDKIDMHKTSKELK